MDFNELRLGANTKTLLDGGLSLEDESLINLNQSPSMPNICYDDGGLPITRGGQAYLFNSSLGSTPINGVFPDYKGQTVLAHGTKLYKQTGSNQPIEIYSGLTDSKAFFFTYNGILYMLNGNQYIQYDGTTVKAVDPYIPQVSINRKPDKSQSTVDESFNMLGSGFKDSFNGDGTSKDYYLSFTGLEATQVKAIVNNVEILEGSGLTVDRVNGKVNFTTAPGTGTNNVKITAYKSFPASRQAILNCRFGIEFSNRIFLSGNSNQPNFYYAGGLTDGIDATYFPEKYRYGIRGADKAVTAFIVFHNKLVVFKEDLTAVVEASTGLDNTASFPISYLNTEIGCDMPGTLQLIDNSPVFCNTYGGVYAIVSTMIPDEKNIIPISRNINGGPSRLGLLQEDITQLKEASSADHNKKYYLAIGNHCYVWDYSKGYKLSKPESLTWLYYTNIHSREFFIRDNELMYLHRGIGHIVRFISAYNDFGQPIKSSWKSKLISFDTPDFLKTVKELWLTTKANSSTNIRINYFNDKGSQMATTDIPPAKLKSFSWSEFSWENFTWRVQIYPPTVKMKPNLRKIRYFQIELISEEYNKPLSIIGLFIKYKLVKKVK